MLVTCRGCKTKIDKDKAFIQEHISKSGKKTNYYYCSKNEYESIEREKDFYKKCQYTTDRILGEKCCDNSRNKKLSELHKRGFTYEEIYQCVSDLEKNLDCAIANKWSEFTSSYNKIAYIFGAINKEIDNYKGKIIKTNEVETVEEIQEYKGRRNVNRINKPTLMDIIKGASNG